MPGSRVRSSVNSNVIEKPMNTPHSKKRHNSDTWLCTSIRFHAGNIPRACPIPKKSSKYQNNPYRMPGHGPFALRNTTAYASADTMEMPVKTANPVSAPTQDDARDLLSQGPAQEAGFTSLNPKKCRTTPVNPQINPAKKPICRANANGRNNGRSTSRTRMSPR